MSVNFDISSIISSQKLMPLNKRSISFKGLETQKTDTFEKNTNIKNFEMNVFNPYTNSLYKTDVSVDLSKPQKIILTDDTKLRNRDYPLTLDYDPKRIDYIWDKKKNKPLETVILISKQNDNEVGYHFMSKDLKREYGYIHLSEQFDMEKARKTVCYSHDITMYKDFPDQGITGPRVVVEYLQNLNNDEYSGVGKLADKLSVKHCLEKNIAPVIVSCADTDSHISHYLRGKRYLPLDKDTNAYEFFEEKYGAVDVNKIIERLLTESKATGKKVDLTDWGLLPMYMPKELAQKYENELKSEM